MKPISFTLGIRTPNPLNGSGGTTRGARMGAAALYRKQHDSAYLLTIAEATKAGAATESFLTRRGGRAVAVRVITEPGPWLVHLTRICAGRLDPHDGLRAALKRCADGVATALGVDDGDEAAVTWTYAQESSPRGTVGVRVEIRRRESEIKIHAVCGEGVKTAVQDETTIPTKSKTLQRSAAAIRRT